MAQTLWAARAFTVTVTLAVSSVAFVACSSKKSSSGTQGAGEPSGAAGSGNATVGGVSTSTTSSPCVAAAVTPTSGSTDTASGSTTGGTANSGGGGSSAGGFGSSNPWTLVDATQLAAVQPIIASNCATSGCHAAGATAPDLSTADNITAQASQIVASIASGTGNMPPSGSTALAAADLTTIQNWANGGGSASGTSGAASVQSTPCASSTTTTDGSGGDGSGTATPTGGGSSGWSPGPGLAGCEQQNLAWVAVASGGGSGACGDPLAAYCCTETEVLRQFPTVAATLKPQIDQYLAGGLKLYNCSLSSSGQTTLHFGMEDSTGIHYQSLYFSGVAASGGASPGACTQLTAADLGITQGSGTDSGTDVATSTTTGSATYPATIGTSTTLANTAPANLLLELSKERTTNVGYRTWSNRASLTYIQGLQIYGKVFWSPDLVASIATNNTTHPVGAASVMEAYVDAAGTQFKGWYVLGKAQTADPSGWFTYQLTGTPNGTNLPTFPAAPQVEDLADSSCSSCHATPAFPTYIISTP